MSGVNFLNTIGLYNPSSNPIIILSILPELCQFCGTVFLIVTNRVKVLKENLWKCRRKYLIRLGTVIAFITMLATFILKIVAQYRLPSLSSYYWLGL